MTTTAMAMAMSTGEEEKTQLEEEEAMVVTPSPLPVEEQEEEEIQVDQSDHKHKHEHEHEHEPSELELNQPEPEEVFLPPTVTQTESTDSTETISKTNAEQKQTTKPTSTYSTMKQYTKGPGRRLVEYFVVVSSLPRKDSSVPVSPNISFQSQFDEIPQNISIEDYEDIDDELNFEPIITARYPKTDHHGNPLHQSVACFCHPAGIIQLKSKPSMPKVSSVCRYILYVSICEFGVELAV